MFQKNLQKFFSKIQHLHSQSLKLLHRPPINLRKAVGVASSIVLHKKFSEPIFPAHFNRSWQLGKQDRSAQAKATQDS